jgi:hypothetical protein
MVSASCGTNAGYFRHRRAGQETCGPCRSAHRRLDSDRNAARQKAASRLAAEHPERWRELYAEELERRGLAAATSGWLR